MKLNSPLILSFIGIMTVITLLFVLFEQESTAWITQTAHHLSQATSSLWIVSLFIVAVLAFDVLLPIPSSLVSMLAATTLGFFSGSLVIWLGLMLGSGLGYLVGAGSKQFFLQRWISQKDLAQAQELSQKIGAGALVTLRGVPVLAEASVIAAGLVRYPVLPFFIITTMANLGLAMAYGYVGSHAEAGESSFWLVIGGSIIVPSAAWLLKYVWEHRPQIFSS